jgi:hypothetical protein
MPHGRAGRLLPGRIAAATGWFWRAFCARGDWQPASARHIDTGQDAFLCCDVDSRCDPGRRAALGDVDAD